MRSPRWSSARFGPVLGFIAAMSAAAGCVVYEPVAVPVTGSPSKYERVWASALAAAGDVGIALTVVDRPAGTIKGARGPIATTIAVIQQPDGGVRVELKLDGPLTTDPTLSDRFYRAYDRYMGR